MDSQLDSQALCTHPSSFNLAIPSARCYPFALRHNRSLPTSDTVVDARMDEYMRRFADFSKELSEVRNQNAQLNEKVALLSQGLSAAKHGQADPTESAEPRAASPKDAKKRNRVATKKELESRLSNWVVGLSADEKKALPKLSEDSPKLVFARIVEST
jgi:hypothetical protein